MPLPDSCKFVLSLGSSEFTRKTAFLGGRSRGCRKSKLPIRPYAEIRVKCGHIARNLLNNRVLLGCIFMHCDVNLLILNERILAAF